jgi:hypothetical protein
MRPFREKAVVTDVELRVIGRGNVLCQEISNHLEIDDQDHLGETIIVAEEKDITHTLHHREILIMKDEKRLVTIPHQLPEIEMWESEIETTEVRMIEIGEGIAIMGLR